MRVDSRKQPEFCVAFRQNPLKVMHDFSASIAKLSETSCGCGRGSKLFTNISVTVWFGFPPPKKLSGVFNYCWLPIHKRGSSQKHTSPCPLPQYIHCEEIIARNSCFLFSPGWLFLRGYTVQPPLITSLQWVWAQVCPPPPSCPDQPLLCQCSAICSCRSSKDTLRCPCTLGVTSRDPAVGYWLLFQILKGWHSSSEMAWRHSVERGVPREIPSFVSCHWKWLWVFGHITQRLCSYNISIQR